MKGLIVVFVILVATLSVPAKADLFDEEAEWQSTRKEAETQIENLGGLLKGIDMMLLFMSEQQMQKGNCLPAIEIEEKATTGDAQSQWYLADLYRRGLCVQASKQKMVHWLQNSADQGYVEATLELGLAFLTGDGVDADPRRAAKLFEAAARKGNDKAAKNLGVMYRDGNGVPQNSQWFLWRSLDS